VQLDAGQLSGQNSRTAGGFHSSSSAIDSGE
jgi:hypothetical protein